MSSPLDIVAIGFLDDNETALFFSSFWYSLALILRMVPLYALHGLHLGTIEDIAFKHKKWQFEARIVDLYRKVLQIAPISPSLYADICRDLGLGSAENSDVRF
jgi:hypothetical protein